MLGYKKKKEKDVTVLRLLRVHQDILRRTGHRTFCEVYLRRETCSVALPPPPCHTLRRTLAYQQRSRKEAVDEDHHSQDLESAVLIGEGDSRGVLGMIFWQ